MAPSGQGDEGGEREKWGIEVGNSEGILVFARLVVTGMS